VRLPWKTLLLQVPTLVEAARQLYGMTRQARGDVEVEDRSADDLAVLERRQEEQAKLVADLATQMEQLAAALVMLRAQLRLALIGAVSGLAVAIVALALVLWRTT
jgi:hypothetical protein